MRPVAFTPRRVITIYLVSNGLFTLATSIIWAVNTLFLMGPGRLNIFQVMLVNTAYVIGQALCEVPTGVVADTVGRKVSYLLGIITLLVSTLLYVLSPLLGWGIPGFIVAGVLIGLGYTFQTGAVDAWLVDALDATGWELPKDRVFAWGSQVLSVATLVGSLLGGLLGQLDLSLPYVARSLILAAAFIFVAVWMREVGFERRILRASAFASETRKIFDAGIRFGWRDPVVRPLLLVGLSSGLFFLFGFYAWQRYMLDLLGLELVWLAGVVQAGFSVATICGSALVRWIAGEGPTRRDPGRILTIGAAVMTALALGIGAVGLVGAPTGVAPFAVATVLWLMFGFVFGVTGPVGQAFVNEHIPSAERATVLSLQAFFADAGGAVGQPILGLIAQKVSIPVAYVFGSLGLAVSTPLYRLAGLAAKRKREDVGSST